MSANIEEGLSWNGIKLTYDFLLSQLLAQVLPGFEHQRKALGPPVLAPWHQPMRSHGVDKQRVSRDEGLGQGAKASQASHDTRGFGGYQVTSGSWTG